MIKSIPRHGESILLDSRDRQDNAAQYHGIIRFIGEYQSWHAHCYRGTKEQATNNGNFLLAERGEGAEEVPIERRRES